MAVQEKEVEGQAQRLNGMEPDAVATFRRAVLGALNTWGFRAISDIPHSWPVTRAHLEGMARRLHDEGLVEAGLVPVGERWVRAYRTTAAGRRELAAGELVEGEAEGGGL